MTQKDRLAQEYESCNWLRWEMEKDLEEDKKELDKENS